MASKSVEKPATTTGEQALATTDFSKGQLQAGMEDYLGGATSDFGQADISIPFLRIVQALSPWVQPADPKYDEDVKQGMIAETVTPSFFKGATGIYVIPVLYTRSYTEWKPNRGGLVADHGSNPEILRHCKREEDSDGRTRLITPAGNELAEAALYYVMWTDDLESDDWQQALLTMAGTQWKKARDWNTNMQRVRMTKADGTVLKNPLPFACIYHFTTIAEKKDNFNFFGWKIQQQGFTMAHKQGMGLLQAAVDFRGLAMSGKVRGADDGITTDDDLDRAFGNGSSEAF